MLIDNDKKNTNVPEENIIDIEIEGTKRQKYRINGGGIIELDTSDVNIVTRLREVYPKLNKLANEATSKVNVDDNTPVEEQLNQYSDVLKEIDSKMRQHIDYIFDSNVSEVCAPTGSMYAPHNGKFRYEHITETLGQLYANKLGDEAKLLSKRLREKTSKYTGKRKK